MQPIHGDEIAIQQSNPNRLSPLANHFATKVVSLQFA
jgi:hypothetical protein